MKKLLAVALAASCIAFAQQTAVYPEQLQQRTKYPGLVISAVLNGKIIALQLGQNVIFDPTSNTLGVAVSAPVPAIETYPITAAASTLPIGFTPVASTLLCYKNGLMMSAGVDYDLAANVLTFRPDASGGPGNAPVPGDVFTCAYSH
jgi:hypothetical protein